MKTLITLAALSALTLCSMEAQQTPAPAKAEQSATPVAPPAKPKIAPKLNADGTMQVEITLGDLLVANSSLSKLFSLDLPIKTALGFSKTVKAVKAEMEGFEEQRLKLVKKYSKPGEMNVAPDRMEAFVQEYNTLADITVKMTITPVSLVALGDSVKLSANDIARLEPFLVP